MTRPRTLHERLRLVAARHPDQIAVSAGTGSLSYGQLTGLAAEIARVLRGQLKDTERLVALRVGRSIYAPAALVGILMADRGYVPVDPDYPAMRQEHILTDCGAALVITDSGARDDEIPVASVGPFTVIRRPGVDPLHVPADTAYVIYTSGSTGTPKGCVVAHRHVLSLFDAAETVFDFGHTDVWTVFHSYSFDFSVWELWGALLHGGRAVTVPTAAANDPEAFKALLREQSVTVLNQVPSVFGFFTQELELFPASLPHLRHVIFGGEAINPVDVKRWEALRPAPEAKLTNMYGITETTVHVTHCRLTIEELDRTPAGTTPIGTALPHLAVRLADEHGMPVPDGEPGEMWVSGNAVAYGYLNRDDLTNDRFVTVNEGGVATRYYRSGDHAVRDADGTLCYVGRKDQQVKLRGFRIELGEVEAAMRTVPGISAAACGVEENRHGHKILAAYIVSEPGTCLTDQQVRAALATSLPAHLRPQRIRRLTGLPVSPHGKLDRKALQDAVSGAS